MAHTHPFLQRRGHLLYFRILVPTALRSVVGQREFTRALKTGDRAKALPLALELGAIAKRLFHDLRHPTMSSNDMRKLLHAAREKLRADAVNEAHQEEICDLQVQHMRQLREAKLQAQVDAYERALDRLPHAKHPPPSPSVATAPVPPTTTPAPLFTTVVDTFLEKYPRDKKAEMFKKQGPALILLRDLIGAKPINELRQANLNDYFTLVGKLPPRWAEKCKKRGLTPQQLAQLKHPLTLGPKTFIDNYLVPVRLFLKYAVKDWQDEGFPTTLTTEGTEYQGDREPKESKQRSFTDDELERLFNGPELTAFRSTPEEAHKWWLPVIGYYTGARVREICQLNPQSDVLEDSASGVSYFWINETDDTDERITKSVKTGTTRTVPIHSNLIKLGLLDYLAALKRKGAKLIFPMWNPNNGRASTQAEKWFREFLKATDLRDETPKAKITGMHAFRHTLLTRARNSRPSIDAGPITGHAGVGKSSVQREYEGEMPVVNKRDLLEAIQFNFVPGQPRAAGILNTDPPPRVET